MTAAYYTYLPNRTAIEEYLRYLQGLEYDRLREIAAFEGMTIPKRSGPAREQALQALASNLASTPGVNRRLLGVTRRELALLRLLWRRGPEIARAGMTAFFAPVLKRGEIERVLERLTFLLLVLPDNSGRFVVPEAVRAALLGRSGLAHPAATLFGALSSDSLGRICDYLGLQGIKNNKQARLTAVVAAVADEQRTRAAIEALDDEERSLFDLLLQGGGQVDSWSLYQRHPSLFPRSSYGGYLLSLNQARAAANDTTAGMRLQLKGLVVAYPADWASQLVVPDEVLVATQPPAELDPADFTEPALAPPPAEAHPAGMHPSPVLDIVEVLRYVEEARPKPTQKGLMPKPESKRLARNLSVQDTSYADLLVTLAIGLGLLDGRLSELRVATEAASAWLARGEREQRADLINTWHAQETWYDNLDEPYPRGSQRGAAVPLRVATTTIFKELPPHGATVESIAARLGFRAPRMFDSRAPGTEALGSAVTPPETWVRGVLRALSWLGIAEPLTVPATPTSPAATLGVRLTEFGRALLQGDEMATRAIAVPRTDRIIVQPTLDVLAPPNIEPALYYRLRELADPAGVGGMRTLTLSAASLRRALDGGMSPAELRALLADHSDAPLPNTVETLLRDVTSKFGRLRVGYASFFLTVDEPALLDEIKADRRTAGLVTRTLAPTVALLSGESAEKIVQRLRDAGHMPVLDASAGGQAARPAALPGGLNLVPDQRMIGQALKDAEGRLEALRRKHTDRASIEEILLAGADFDFHVQLEYRSKTHGQYQLRTRKVDVLELSDDNTVSVYDHLTNQERELRKDRITWAKLLTEPCCELAYY